MRNFRGFVSTLFALFCAGCSLYDDPLLSSGPSPRVEDCALIQQATPVRYVCAGKTYTAVELAEIRNGNKPGAADANVSTAGPAKASPTLATPVKTDP
jgi:hypothetical protein